MTRIADIDRPRRGQEGLTLVELLVTILILGIVSVITFTAFMSGTRTVGRVDDDVRGQGDQRIVSERLIFDLRQARGIEAPGASVDPARSLTVWIDDDADYIRETGEVVTWELSSTADSAGHYNVLRRVGSGSPEIVARALVSGIAFAYKNRYEPALTGANVTRASVVVVTMEYDAIVGAYLQKKYTTFEARLRNVS